MAQAAAISCSRMEKLLPWEHPIFFSLWQALASEFWSRVLRLKEIDFISRPLVLLDYNLLFYCRLVCCRKQFSIKGQTHIARTAAIGVQQRQLPISLIIHSGCRTLFSPCPPKFATDGEKKARERPSSANNTWLCVRAADLIMRFGGNFPNKAQKNMAPPSS